MSWPDALVESAARKAADYAAWAAAAQAQDSRSGAQRWRDEPAGDLYDHRALGARLERLRQLRGAGDDEGLLFALNEGIHGNQDGMGDERLWQRARFGTQQLIHDYVDALAEALDHLAGSSALTPADKLDFFERASLCHGRSGLLLSGAGATLHFHVGVARALLGQGLLPGVIAGASGGALVAALLCSRTDAELAPLLETPAQQALVRAAAGGDLPEQLARLIAAALPDLSFRQAWERSGRHLCLSVAPSERHQGGRLLSAVTSPDVCIREAVLASCAVPLVLPPVTLMAFDRRGRRVPFEPDRRWVDGSVSHDLPMRRLARLYGVNHHIVSQANPLVTPLAAQLRSPRSPMERVQRAAAGSLRDWFSLGLDLADRPLGLFAPRLHELNRLSQAMLNQDYAGDIDIVRPVLGWPPHKLLAQPGAEDVRMLVELGERTAWPHIERIRLQTQVSRQLDRIMAGLDSKTGAVAYRRRRASADPARRRR